MSSVRSSSGRSGRRLKNEINVVPYIDVMLVLLIIFMVTAPLITPGVIELPSVGQAANVPLTPLEIQINESGKIEWRKREADFNEIDGRIARLNERDQDTLQLILAGVSNKAMASRLFISERAVEMRRAAIMRKLEVRNVAELIKKFS